MRRHPSHPLESQVSREYPRGAIEHTNGYTLRVHEIIQRVLHELREMIRQVLVADATQVVVVRVLRHSSIEICPSKDVLIEM